MNLIIITGACGAGKSTMRDALEPLLDNRKFACIDSDELGLNWWDYAGTDHESKYKDDCLEEAVKRAGGRNLIFVTCFNPQDYFSRHTIPKEVESSLFIVLCPTDEEIEKRLKARPAERGFTSDEIIRPHIEFNRWFRSNKGKFPLFIDNTDMSVDDTAARIVAFISSIY